MIRRGLPDREVVPLRESVSVVRQRDLYRREDGAVKALGCPAVGVADAYVVEHLSPKLPARCPLLGAGHHGARKLAYCPGTG